MTVAGRPYPESARMITEGAELIQQIRSGPRLAPDRRFTSRPTPPSGLSSCWYGEWTYPGSRRFFSVRAILHNGWIVAAKLVDNHDSICGSWNSSG